MTKKSSTEAASTPKVEKSKRQTKEHVHQPARPLTDKDLANLAKATHFSKAEVAHKYGLFRAFEANNHLDQAGFIKFYSALRYEGQCYLEKISQVIFKSLDGRFRKNGLLTFNEVFNFYVQTIRSDTQRKLELAFTLYDIDSKGVINRHDIYRVLTAMLDLLDADKEINDATEYTEECVAALDTSRSGRITKSDFVTGLLRNYSLRVLMSPFH